MERKSERKINKDGMRSQVKREREVILDVRREKRKGGKQHELEKER